MPARSFVILTLAAFSLAAQEPLGPAAKGVNLYSLEKEAALGKQLASEVRRQATPLADPAVQTYLDTLGRRIAAHLPDARFPFTFEIIADDPCRTIHEPTALPGGYVFVSAALFRAVRDEAEFAGMLTHAMAHIALRHGTRQATRGELVNYSSTPLVYMGGVPVSCSEGQAIPFGFLYFLRQNELEADALAIRTLARSGFDPEAFERYIERLQPELPAGRTAYTPLPARNQRLAAIHSLTATLPPANEPAPTGGFSQVQQIVTRLLESRTPPKPPPRLKRAGSPQEP